MTILSINAQRLVGKSIAKLQDEHGNDLKDLVMLDALVIYFEDGDKIILRTDWYGEDCYISQNDR